MVCSEVEVIAVCWDRLEATGRSRSWPRDAVPERAVQSAGINNRVRTSSVNAAKESAYCAKREAEQKLVEQTRAWLKNDHRDPRIHASDLFDPRKAYWDRQHPVEPSTRMVGHFFVGKVLHAFFLSALNGRRA